MSYLVEVDGDAFAVRIPGRNTELYLDREAEKKNMELLGRTGVSPQLVDFRKDSKIMIREFIRGKVATKKSFKDPELRRKTVTAIKQLHESRIVLCNDFNVFTEIRRYQGLVKNYGEEILNSYPTAQICKTTENIERELAKHASIKVACHNDLLPENFILTNDGIRIVDWEYAGMNDRCYDIANHIAELDNLEDEEEAHIIDLYFDGDADRERWKVDLYRLPSRFLWALWAVIQYHTSELEFDYDKYARYQLDQCLRHIDILEMRYPHLF